jgi:hypothetical protein
MSHPSKLRRLLQEALARAEKAERERDSTALNMGRHVEELARELEDARRELARCNEIMRAQ